MFPLSSAGLQMHPEDSEGKHVTLRTTCAHNHVIVQAITHC